SGVGISAGNTLTNVPFPLTAAQLILPPPSIAPPYTLVYAFDPHLELPYTLEWNLAVERALGKSQTLTGSYVGAAARRLLYQYQARPARSGNPNFSSTGQLNIITNGPTSDYDALQVQFQRRLSHGLQALASYTWAHAIDEASVNSVTRQLLRANSNFDIRHNFQAIVTYEVPDKYSNPFARAILRHWSLDARVTGRSALPCNVSGVSRLKPTETKVTFGADLVPGQPIYISDATAPGGRRVNFNAFMIPTAAEIAAGNFGNAPRNFLRGFPAWQMDLA